MTPLLEHPAAYQQRCPGGHWTDRWDEPCAACAAKATKRPAPNAPDCPNPSWNMRYQGAAWRYGCSCPSCTTRREAVHERRLAASHASHRFLDDVAVDRTVAGDPPARLTRAERLEATRRLTRAGMPAPEIARVIRTTPRTVTRYRAELRGQT